MRRSIWMSVPHTTQRRKELRSRRNRLGLPKKSEKDAKQKKRPQLLIMGQILQGLLDATAAPPGRPYHVLDIGGAKGLLAQYVAARFGPSLVNVTVVDVNLRAILSGRARLLTSAPARAACHECHVRPVVRRQPAGAAEVR